MAYQFKSIEEFLQASYSDRQLVSFVDDQVYEAKLLAEENEKSSKGFEDYAKIFVDSWTESFIAISQFSSGLLKGGSEMIQSYLEARKKGVQANLIPKSWVAQLKLPPGHPREGVLYAGHPADPKTYIPIAAFHRFTFEHKFSELVSILMHLGAKKILVEYVRGWGSKLAASLSAGIPAAQVGASAGAEKKKDKTGKILYNVELSGTDSPSIPDNLVWYPHESTWQMVAEGRLSFGLKNFSLQLEYQDDYGVNAGLKMNAEKVGFDVGGEFERHEATTWSISGSF